MAMPAKLFIDTNILVYLTNASSPFHARVQQQFQELSARYGFYISRQVLREYAVIMTRPGIVQYPLTPDQAAQDIEKWVQIFSVTDETSEVTDKLVALLRKYALKGKRIHDANIVSAMLAHSIKSIFTNNSKDFKKFDEIEIIEVR